MKKTICHILYLITFRFINAGRHILQKVYLVAEKIVLQSQKQPQKAATAEAR